jgi:hypothetical protein
MARTLRSEYPGAIRQVMNRGDRRAAIFRDDADRQRLFATPAGAGGKTDRQVHALCRMASHFLPAGITRADGGAPAEGRRRPWQPPASSAPKPKSNRAQQPFMSHEPMEYKPTVDGGGGPLRVRAIIKNGEYANIKNPL